MVAHLETGWDFKNVTAEVIVKASKGILHAIVFNGVTTVGDVLVYDGVDNTGALIATLNIRVAVSVSYQGMTFLYDVKCATGIFITFSSFVGNITATFL